MNYIRLALFLVLGQLTYINILLSKDYDGSREQDYAYMVMFIERCEQLFPAEKASAKAVRDALEFRLEKDPGYAGFSKTSAETKAAFIKNRAKFAELIAKKQIPAELDKESCSHVFMGNFGSEVRRLAVIQPSAAVPPGFYQDNFLSSPYVKEFAAWQITFYRDLTEFWFRMEHDADTFKSLLASPAVTGFDSLFSNSIDRGKKGLEIKKMFVSEAIPKNRPAGSMGIPYGSTIFTHILLGMDESGKGRINMSSHAVGYGGKYKDGENTIERFYISTEDMRKAALVTPQQKGTQDLPKFGVYERGAWLTIEFTRTVDNKLVLYSLPEKW